MNYQESRKLQSSGRSTYIRLGTVEEVSEDGRCRIKFDGEDHVSGKFYTALRTGVDILAGDRAACARVSGSWLILGTYKEET